MTVQTIRIILNNKINLIVGSSLIKIKIVEIELGVV